MQLLSNHIIIALNLSLVADPLSIVPFQLGVPFFNFDNSGILSILDESSV
jgi:hypothetical protein